MILQLAFATQDETDRLQEITNVRAYFGQQLGAVLQSNREQMRPVLQGIAADPSATNVLSSYLQQAGVNPSLLSV